MRILAQATNTLRRAAATSMLLAVAACADAVTAPAPAQQPMAIRADSAIDDVLDDVVNRLGDTGDPRVAPLLIQIKSDLAAGRLDVAAPNLASLGELASHGLDPAEQDLIALSIDDVGARWKISPTHSTSY